MTFSWQGLFLAPIEGRQCPRSFNSLKINVEVLDIFVKFINIFVSNDIYDNTYKDDVEEDLAKLTSVSRSMNSKPVPYERLWYWYHVRDSGTGTM